MLTCYHSSLLPAFLEPGLENNFVRVGGGSGALKHSQAQHGGLCPAGCDEPHPAKEAKRGDAGLSQCIKDLKKDHNIFTTRWV